MEAEPKPEIGERDWTEDLAYENDNYYGECAICGNDFLGHKRRVICKVCAQEQLDA